MTLRPPALSDVAEHVESVLAAAEQAAETLRQAAERDAEQIRRQATRAAEAELARARETARDVQAEADAYADTRQRDAESHAMRLLREAEHRATLIPSVAAKRHSRLLDDIDASERRIRELAHSLRDVAGQLEAVAGGSAGGEPSALVDLFDDGRGAPQVEERGQ
jgi:alanyl-tRNA synthetase